MAQYVRGAVAPGKGLPVELRTIVVPDPGRGEAEFDVQACAVCHTGHRDQQGGIGDDSSDLFGHEAAGLVEAVGEGVPGACVVLNWRAARGDYRACRFGRLYLQGRLVRDAFASEAIGLDGIETALDRMPKGEVLGSVVWL
ncbi:alcohol dehydrogenase catalytic domain-containing protein [Streptomyces sp. NPDC054855]